jgi:hypothetical protein
MSTHIFVLLLAVLCTGIKADSSFFNCTSMLPSDKEADCNTDASAAPINFVVRNSAGTPVMTFGAGDTLTIQLTFTGSTAISEFLLRASPVMGKRAIGTWEVDYHSPASELSCNSQSDMVTNGGNFVAPWTRIEATWTAPNTVVNTEFVISLRDTSGNCYAKWNSFIFDNSY